ncbi:hypothetical protein D3C73_1398530 [compost metagenome]
MEDNIAFVRFNDVMNFGFHDRSPNFLDSIDLISAGGKSIARGVPSAVGDI